MPKPATVITDEQVIEIEALAAVLNQNQIADYLGIAERTFRDIKKRDERVSAAYKRGRAKAINDVGTSLLKKARDGDTSSSIFYLKTQAGWKDTTVTEHQGAIEHVIRFE